ncbi:aminotransferase class I/II-fold pyridoxal phosphate-dependent enzyme [candidate division KSB1 bacterium]|nr:aminotransferase class I/II-fold pyridoxal phosphate-dependent enzyme [candidate division KSB1 bacterium]
MPIDSATIYIHPTATISEQAVIGAGTKIWHYVHVREGARIGANCVLGKDVYVDHYVSIGNNVKIQNGVSVYHGVTLEDEVFVGPNAVFTNDLLPRAHHTDWRVVETIVERGASIGANATIVCGVRLGEHCMVGAGSVVIKNVPAHALVVGNPARTIGYVCTCGRHLHRDYAIANSNLEQFVCESCKRTYELPMLRDQREEVVRTGVDGIRFVHHNFDEDTLSAVESVLQSGWVAGCGGASARFEKELAELSHCEYAVAMNSCTSALFAAVRALEIGPGDEVIVADFSFPASGMSVMHAGAAPRFVDVRLDTYNLDIERLAALVNKKTRAVMVVHTFGQMAPTRELYEWCKARGLALIEDAACSIGSSYDGVVSGEYSDLACYSFHGRKIITTGEGGAVVTNNAELYRKVRALSSLGVDASDKYKAGGPLRYGFHQLGYNFRLSDINCAIGLQQLRHLPALLERRREAAERYRQALAGLPGFALPHVDPKAYHTYQAFVCRVENEKLRDYLMAELKKKNLHTTIGTYAQHLELLFESKEVCPNSRELRATTLTLPFHSFLGKAQVEYVAEQVRETLKFALESSHHLQS